MAIVSKVERITFAGGELGELLHGRADLAKYQIALEAQENFVTMVEGVPTRAPGTRFVLELKAQDQKGRLLPFRYSSTDYYMLVINGEKARLVREGGFIQNPDTSPFEFSVPWVEEDLPKLRAAQDGNSMYVVSGNKKPQEITRLGHTDWTCEDFVSTNGPVDTQNSDLAVTVQASNGSGTGITLTGVGNPFSAGMVGGIMRIDDGDLSATPQWVAGETAIALNQLRRWNGNVYQAMLSGKDAGSNAPVHTEGDASAGADLQTWRFIHPGYGFVKIVSVTNGNSATADVLSQLPATVVSNPTHRFYPPAWSDTVGWPDIIAFHSTRLFFARGPYFWLTAVDDPHNLDQAKGDDDDAIVGRIRAPDASLVEIRWALSSGVLMIGTPDLEWVLRATDVFGALTPKAARPYPLTEDGSESHVPVRVDGGAMFIGKTAKRMHYAKFEPEGEKISGTEVSVTGRHVYQQGIAGLAWQRDPHRVVWMARKDGSLASLTFMPAQDIVAVARHPRQNFFVEDIAVIPSVSSGVDEVYLIVRRVINGQVKRYIEQIANFFEPQDASNPTADGAWFLDCAIRTTGVAMTEIALLTHLEGETVGVFADGVMQKDKVVSGGKITLDRAANDVLVGLKITARLKDLPRGLNSDTGSSIGKLQTVHEAYLHLRHTGGGRLRCNGGEWENIIETGGANYGAHHPLFTGRKLIDVDGDTEETAQLELICDDAMPCTVLGLSPKIMVEEEDD